MKKITEKYAHRPFLERLEVLEKKLEQKHDKHRENLMKQSSNIEGFGNALSNISYL